MRDFGRTLTLLVTNAIKVAGLVGAVHEMFLPQPNAVPMALSAFMMAGAQISEQFVLGFVSRMFNPHPPPLKPPAEEHE